MVRRGRAGRQRGVTYLALLLAVAIVGGMAGASASVWSHVQRREREKQLLWAGDEIRRALVSYSRAPSRDGNAFPYALQELLLDSRSSVPRRHLRRIYDDPMVPGGEWGLLRDARGRIVGVHSRSQAAPIKRANFADPYPEFEGAATYADWRFAAAPPAGPDAGAASSRTPADETLPREADSATERPAPPTSKGAIRALSPSAEEGERAEPD